MIEVAHMSSKCRFCASRVVVAMGESREQAQRRHEASCALSVDCPHCDANVGQVCKAPNGRTVRHTSRALL